jgi:hypothetical protein
VFFTGAPTRGTRGGRYNSAPPVRGGGFGRPQTAASSYDTDKGERPR